MDSANLKPTRPGRFELMTATPPRWLASDSNARPLIEGWAALSNVYPAWAKVTSDPNLSTHHPGYGYGGGRDEQLATVTVEVSGWGEVVIAGPAGRGRPGDQLIMSTTLNYALARDLIGLELDSPVGWRWMRPAQVAELMILRARLMLLGLTATWANAGGVVGHDGGELLNQFARRWKYDDGAAVELPERWLDLRDPETWYR